MHTHKEIGLHFSGFLNPYMKGHKVIGITRQVGAHGAALDLAGIDAISKLQSDLKHHIFFLGAIGADGTRVFATMARINGHHNQPVGDGRGLYCGVARCGCMAAWGGRRIGSGRRIGRG